MRRDIEGQSKLKLEPGDVDPIGGDELVKWQASVVLAFFEGMVHAIAHAPISDRALTEMLTDTEFAYALRVITRVARKTILKGGT